MKDLKKDLKNYPSILLEINGFIFLFLFIPIIYLSSNILLAETKGGWEFNVEHHFWEFLFARMILNTIVISIFSLLIFILNYLTIKIFGAKVKKIFKYLIVLPFLLMQSLSTLFLIIAVFFPRSLFYFVMSIFRF